MKIIRTEITDVMIVETEVFSDHRGFFMESFNLKNWREMTGLQTVFVQENHSHSYQGVLRGLHYQIKQPQGKLVRVVQGEVYDVAVDLRQFSPTFKKWIGVVLSAENKRQLWVPEGFAHGFLVLSESADFVYKMTNYYHPEYACCVRWDDPEIGIEWPCRGYPLLSPNDAAASQLSAVPVFENT